MKSDLFFDFSINKENNTIVIKREFDANLEQVWQAWTKTEFLDRWWAPKPYRVETKTLNFTEGGVWLYAMVSPENEKLWCKADYQKIEFKKLIVWLDAFCDENGHENTQKPRSNWSISFSTDDHLTTVHIILKHDSYKDVETMIDMGFKEGFTMCMQNLDELLPEVNK
ncbi:SRPBCC family protein [Elizabethkingia anophelis]|uniref:SRPBCC family protein n=1 Tax=Elizabethkingia anophelis TaxID=1117645 RepID=UPI00293C3CC9|nr:ATPase [Elizabethkingia anophelis]